MVPASATGAYHCSLHCRHLIRPLVASDCRSNKVLNSCSTLKPRASPAPALRLPYSDLGSDDEAVSASGEAVELWHVSLEALVQQCFICT